MKLTFTAAERAAMIEIMAFGAELEGYMLLATPGRNMTLPTSTAEASES